MKRQLKVEGRAVFAPLRRAKKSKTAISGSQPSTALRMLSGLNPQPIIEVSAALIFRNGKLLITRRHSHSHLGGLWEFPGGKRESKETFAQCLVREIREELGVDIFVGELFESVTHAYPEKTVRLEFFVCRLLNGEPKPLGCAALQWVTRPELADYAFPAADARLLGKLLAATDLWLHG